MEGDKPDAGEDQKTAIEGVPDAPVVQSLGNQVAADGEEVKEERKEEDELEEGGIGLGLGQHVMIVGGPYDKQAGTIYFFDIDEDGNGKLHFMPDQFPTILFPMTFQDGKPIDPQFADIEFHQLKEYPEEGYTFLDVVGLAPGMRVYRTTTGGQALTGVDGKETIWVVKSVDEKTDTAVFTVEGTDEEVPLDFKNKDGYSSGIQESDFAIFVKVQDEDESPTEDQIASAAQEEKEEEDTEILLDGLEEYAIPTFENPLPSYQRTYGEMQQKDEMRKQLRLTELSSSQQQNPLADLRIRRLVENMAQLKDQLQQSEATKTPFTYETLLELLKSPDFSLSRPVLNVAKSLYLDHSQNPENDQTTVSEVGIDLQYLSDAVRKGEAYKQESFMNAERKTSIEADARPRWYSVYDEYFKRYMSVQKPIATAELERVQTDTDFFRIYVPTNTEPNTPLLANTLNGLPVIPYPPGKSGKPSERTITETVITPYYIGKVSLGPMRAISSRETRLKSKILMEVETADRAQILSYIVFPFFFLRQLGAIRSGNLAYDIGTAEEPILFMKKIIEEFGIQEPGKLSDILAVSVAGTSLMNLPVDQWLAAQHLYGAGFGDLLPYLQSVGLATHELNPAQKLVLNKKVELLVAAVKKFILQNQEALLAKTKQPLSIASNPFLSNQSVFFEAIGSQVFLFNLLNTFTKELPLYKDNDLAKFAFMISQYKDYTLATLANYKSEGRIGQPANLALERWRAGRLQYLTVILEKEMTRRKTAMAGSPPTPNRCPHVKDLEKIRTVEDEFERMKLLNVFLMGGGTVPGYKWKTENHWLWCNKCKGHLLCEHEYLLMQEFFKPKEKQLLHKNLLLTFSGGELAGRFICKQCGQSISRVPYETTYDKNDSGVPINAGPTEEEMQEEELRKDILPEFEGRDLTITEKQTETLFLILRTFATRLGISPSKTSYEIMLRRVKGLLQEQLSFADYNNRIAKAIKEKTGQRFDSYETYDAKNKVSFCAAAFLLDVQSKIPDYIPRYVLPGCRKPEFSGFPLGEEKDKTAVEYMGCAVLASLADNESIWAMTGYGLKKTETRAFIITKDIEDALKLFLQKAELQQDLTKKRQALVAIFGAEVSEYGRAADSIPDGFRPLQIVVSKDMQAASKEPIITDAASPEQRIYAWILEAHRIAGLHGTYNPKSPFSEASCCFTPVEVPKQFWNSQTQLPQIPKKTPPRGPMGSFLLAHMRPRKQAKLLGTADASIMYRLFLRVCFPRPAEVGADPTHIGLQHEPGYTVNGKCTCSFCQFQFYNDPRLPPPVLRGGKDQEETKKLEEQYNKEVEQIRTRDLEALADAGVSINKESFEELLTESNRHFLVSPVETYKITKNTELLADLETLNPQPFDGFADMLKTLKTNLQKPDLKSDEIAVFYGEFSEKADRFQQSIGNMKASEAIQKIWNTLFTYSPETLASVLRTYFLVPIQLSFLRTSLKSLKQSKSANLSRGSVYTKLTGADRDTLSDKLEIHLESVAVITKELEKSTTLEDLLQSVVDKLTICIPVFAQVLRPNLFIGGKANFDSVVRAMLGGILSDFTNPFVSDKDSRKKILQALLIKLEKEGLRLTPEEIRAELERRKEAEKQEVIQYFDKMDLESRRIALQLKKLGLGERYGIAREKFMKYSPEIQALEAERRIAQGLGETIMFDLPDSDADPNAEEGFDVADYGDGEGEHE
jgi:hypothetical protein